jgi:hypothetical protein
MLLTNPIGVKGGPVQFQNEPRLRCVQHPRAHGRHELADKEQAEVPVSEGAEEGFYHGKELHKNAPSYN